ncbi:MAG: alpha-D-xyloside xylohydrolase [Actinomycetota bacterium]|nr:alpha-D-xyloside xylohydrolase [Actinomycetota bacterium]
MTTPHQPVLEFQNAEHFLRVEPWGTDSVRVRAGRHSIVDNVPGALEGGPLPAGAFLSDADLSGTRRLVVGKLSVELDRAGVLRFVRNTDGAELLREEAAHFAWPGPRTFTSNGDGYYRLEERFAAYAGERIYGLGQHQHGRLNQKGLVLDLVQRNAEVSIPFVVSSRGYGLLWNSPAVGRVEFADNGTRWVADSARQIDYWLTTGDTPQDLLAHYADATGHPPTFPRWAAGLWQSRLRYGSQKELLEVAHEHARRGIPVSVIVIDYYHWTHLGDWKFDSEAWPDPSAMVKELAALGMRVMVSVWPSVNPLSDNYLRMRDEGMLIGTESGVPFHHVFSDIGFHGRSLGVAFYDATDARARAFLWDQLRENYAAHGIEIFWLDACEPEMFPEQHANLVFAGGPGREVANLYPREHARGIYDHMHADGYQEVISLVRSAWAGSQRYGAALWSGDIPTTFDSLAAQVRAGLNAAMSGIPWWTTDIGGFHGGDPSSEEFRELVIRWFQYAVFCPLLRMHGHRLPHEGAGAGHRGGPNELWSYGDEAYTVMRALVELRTRLTPYLLEQMDHATATGIPPMRPLFLEFPADPTAWEVEDQFLLGPDILVAPVTELGARKRQVYLPAGAEWTHTDTGCRYTGGDHVVVDAPLDRIPLFVRDDAQVPLAPEAL